MVRNCYAGHRNVSFALNVNFGQGFNVQAEFLGGIDIEADDVPDSSYRLIAGVGITIDVEFRAVSDDLVAGMNQSD